MFNGNLKVVFYTLILGVFLGITTAAYASSLKSPYHYYGPIFDKQYRNQAIVTSHANVGVSASTLVESLSGNVPAGYMGAQANLYNVEGQLVRASSWRYNTSPLVGFVQSTNAHSASSGSYWYSRGRTSAYNGDGFTQFLTLATPMIQHQ